MGVEQIEEWIGEEVLDLEGERVGKLDEVFYPVSGGEAVFVAVKSGLLGRHSSLVPLANATVGRDYLHLAYSKAAIEHANSDLKGGDGVDRYSARELGDLYGVQIPADEDYESASVINERRRAAEEAQRRAAELEEEARRRETDAHDARGSAQSAQEQAAAKARESEQARAEADRAREDAERAAPS